MTLKRIRDVSFVALCALYFSIGAVSPTNAEASVEGTCTYRCANCYVSLVGCDWCESGGEHGECTSSGIGCASVCWMCDGEGQECFGLEAARP